MSKSPKAKRLNVESFDEACRFPVTFTGELGSRAHYEHHQTLMAKLAAKAFVHERRMNKQSNAK